SLSPERQQKVYFLPNRYQKTKEQKEGLNQLNETRRDVKAGVVLPTLSQRPALYGSLLNGNKDNYQQQAQTACQEKEEKEKQIIQQINQDLHLGLNNPSLKQVINRIQQLINKPPIYFTSDNGNLQKELDQANQTITRLEQELATNNTPFGENLETIKEIDLKGLVKELNIQLSPNAIQQMEQATNYQ
ncbi:8194_t:CDS:1, partial [Entrophospora sp. SA101]